MSNRPFRIFWSEEFREWLIYENKTSTTQINRRLANIQHEGHFGDSKDLGGGVLELRWKNGRRIYFSYIDEEKIIILLGGNKNGQDKDITRAKNLYQKLTKETTSPGHQTWRGRRRI